MKKFFVSLVMLLSLSAACVFAQSSQIATLIHEGEITAFYGSYALKEAHAAAVHGDAITLSSGTFQATNITKAITLRGAGMAVDTLNNVLPTVIAGDFSIQIADSVSEKLMIEGVFHNSLIAVEGTVRDARFNKSRFRLLFCDLMENCSFLHCKIVEDLYFASAGSDCLFINSYVRLDNQNKSSLQFINCVIRERWTGRDFNIVTQNSSFINCIMIGSGGSSDYLEATASAYNCVAINCQGNNCFRNIPDVSNQHSTFEAMFKEYNGTYEEGGTTFELTEEAKTKFLGTDGTQIGIYGGNIPYSPIPTNPRITKCNVAAKSTADGKLSVDIEVNSVE